MARAFAYSPGFDEHLDATISQRFVSGCSISVPLTIAFGGKDRLLLRHQSRHRDQLPPQTRWFELSGCGHVPTYDDPDLVAEVILREHGPRWGRRVLLTPAGAPLVASAAPMRRPPYGTLCVASTSRSVGCSALAAT
jgi:hypothetical protein